MNKKIVYTDPDEGNLCVVHTQEPLEQVAAKVVPSGVPFQIVDASAIPTDRAFRNAWTWDGAQIKEDFAKSIAITKERLRAERAPLLAAADVKAMRDIESTGAVSPETLTLKQALRDVTALADAAKSREELLALKVAAVVKA